jgi:hypothetical protein
MKIKKTVHVIKRMLAEHARNGAEAVVLTLGFEEWQKDDAPWFEKHPRRSFRLRRIYKGEKVDQLSTHMLVRQIEPGFRDKLPVSSTADTTGEFLDSFEDSDKVLIALWREMSTSHGAIVPINKIAATIAEMFPYASAGGMQ